MQTSCSPWDSLRAFQSGDLSNEVMRTFTGDSFESRALCFSALTVLVLVALPSCAGLSDRATPLIRLDSAAAQGVRDAKMGAPMAARALAIMHTCMYDAWAAYDEKAVGTQLGGVLRRPASEREAGGPGLRL